MVVATNAASEAHCRTDQIEAAASSPESFEDGENSEAEDDICYYKILGIVDELDDIIYDLESEVQHTKKGVVHLKSGCEVNLNSSLDPVDAMIFLRKTLKSSALLEAINYIKRYSIRLNN
jgi:hypothetical protein